MLGGPFGLGSGCCCNGGAGVAEAPGASGSPVVGSTSSHSDERSPELKLKPITIYTDIEQGKLRHQSKGACVVLMLAQTEHGGLGVGVVEVIVGGVMVRRCIPNYIGAIDCLAREQRSRTSDIFTSLSSRNQSN